MAASFPTSNPSNATLWVTANFKSTALNGGHDNSTNIVTVLDTTGFPSSGYVVAETEVIKYTSTTGTTFKNCTRGADGSSAAAHSTAVSVYHNWVADHHNALKDEVVAIATNLTTRLGGHATNITVAQLGAAGTVTNPQYSFSTGSGTDGLYLIGADNVGMSINSVINTQWKTTGFGIKDGSAAAPGIFFNDDANSGAYRIGADNIGISTNGTLNTQWNTTGMGILNGTVTNPGLFFSGDTDTGMYYASGQMRFALGGALGFSISASQTNLYGGGSGTLAAYTTTTGLKLVDGSVTNPGIAFGDDTDNGFYRTGANGWSASVGGTRAMAFSTSSISCKLDLDPTGNKALDSGANGTAWDDIWADDHQNEGDVPFFDTAQDLEGKEIQVDDLAIIRGIKPAKDRDGKLLYSDNGFSYWDDTSLPEWIFTREKDEVTRTRSSTSPIARSGEGKPYISLKVLSGLALGGIKQLEERVAALEG